MQYRNLAYSFSSKWKNSDLLARLLDSQEYLQKHYICSYVALTMLVKHYANMHICISKYLWTSMWIIICKYITFDAQSIFGCQKQKGTKCGRACITVILDVLWGQPIMLVQLVSTSEFHEYWWKELENIFLVPAAFWGASEVRTQRRP